jgi:parvulin-like peptidyl-prolyl isomerase
MNAWSGPVESGFGLHLVRVTSRTPARLPPLAEVRDAVERDWLRDRTTRAERTYMAALRAHYTIEVDADLARAVVDHGAPRSGDGAP